MSIRIISTGSIDGRPRSDDRPTPPPRDEMNRKTAPDRDSVAPSSPAPVANRITATESPTKKSCNGLLQQNRHKADIPKRPISLSAQGGQARPGAFDLLAAIDPKRHTPNSQLGHLTSARVSQ